MRSAGGQRIHPPLSGVLPVTGYPTFFSQLQGDRMAQKKRAKTADRLSMVWPSWLELKRCYLNDSLQLVLSFSL
jgi:hypothetical protein